jgi:predicted nucleic acid-binding protein
LRQLVVDCSVVMSWCFEDEVDTYADSILDQLSESEAIVPSIWPLEVANVLLVAERRSRLTQAESLQFVGLLGELPIAIDEETSRHALSEAFLIARQHNLSSYDAAYLELAMRRGAVLATRDERLKKAALDCGVRLA